MERLVLIIMSFHQIIKAIQFSLKYFNLSDFLFSFCLIALTGKPSWSSHFQYRKKV